MHNSLYKQLPEGHERCSLVVRLVEGRLVLWCLDCEVVLIEFEREGGEKDE